MNTFIWCYLYYWHQGVLLRDFCLVILMLQQGIRKWYTKLHKSFYSQHKLFSLTSMSSVMSYTTQSVCGRFHALLTDTLNKARTQNLILSKSLLSSNFFDCCLAYHCLINEDYYAETQRSTCDIEKWSHKSK